MQGKKQYQEKLFTNFHLSERIPPENFYRRLKVFLPLQWLYKTSKKYYRSQGQSSIDPVVFFKLMLIGYLENLGSDRRMISTVSMHLDMLFFIGYDIEQYFQNGLCRSYKRAIAAGSRSKNTKPKREMYNPLQCPCCKKETMLTLLRFNRRGPPVDWHEEVKKILECVSWKK